MMTEPTEQGWEPALAPMASLENHIHGLTYFVVVEAGGLIRFADPDAPHIWLVDEVLLYRQSRRNCTLVCGASAYHAASA